MSVPETQLTPGGDQRKVIVGGNVINVQGSMLYARKDIVVEEIDGIIIPDQAGMTRPVEGSDQGDLQAHWSPRESTDSAVVLAIGPKVDGTRVNDEEVHIGSRVMIQSGEQAGVFRSPYYEWDFFLDISVIVGIISD